MTEVVQYSCNTILLRNVSTKFVLVNRLTAVVVKMSGDFNIVFSNISISFLKSSFFMFEYLPKNVKCKTCFVTPGSSLLRLNSL